VLVPGGGAFADVVRGLDERFSLSCGASHRMAILGMDQYGLLLSDLTPNSAVVNRLEKVESVLASGKLPIFLPSNLLLNGDPLENSWDVTSDSITVYLAALLGVRKVVLVTDVDGVYTSDPKKHPSARLIKKLSASELLAMDARTSVDKFLPKLLLKFHIDCFVINGLFLERVAAILNGEDAVCTLITSNYQRES
jgi:aspartokinase-like uncharacterized kinase